MSITYRGESGAKVSHSATFEDVTLGSITATKPTGVVQDDFMFALFSVALSDESVPNITTVPAGWQLEETNGSQYLYKKIAGDAEPANYTWTISIAWTGQTVRAVLILRLIAWDNVSLTTPINAKNSGGVGFNTTSHPAPSVTTTRSNTQLVCFYTCNRELDISPPLGMTNRGRDSLSASTFPSFVSISALVADKPVMGAGQTGLQTAMTSQVCQSFEITIALTPAGPSTPAITSPVAGQKIQVGNTHNILFAQSNDPGYAQGQLVYEIDYSENGGSTYNALTTSATNGSFSWNTTGRTPGTNYKLRIRAKNPDGIYSDYAFSGIFTLRADVAPLKPYALAPSSGIQDRTATITLSYTFNDEGDAQSRRVIKYRLNGGAYTTSDVSTASTSLALAPNTFTEDGIVDWYVVTYDAAGNVSPDSDVATFNVADTPDPPVITSPTDGGTIGEPQPIIMWIPGGGTSDGYQVVITNTSNVTEWDSGEVTSAATQRKIGITLADDSVHRAKVRTRDAGLWSSFASAEFTVDFVEPDAPTAEMFGNNEEGRIEGILTNTSLASHNIAYRFLASAGSNTAIPIALIDNNGVLLDYGVAGKTEPQEPLIYGYYFTAVSSNGTTATSEIYYNSLSLSWVYVSRALNPASAIKLLADDQSETRRPQVVFHPFKGRSKRAASHLPIQEKALHYTVRAQVQETAWDDLIALMEEQTTVLVRDPWGNKMYAVIMPFDTRYQFWGRTIDISFEEVDFNEAIDL